jgi:hypothetical protein
VLFVVEGRMDEGGGGDGVASSVGWGGGSVGVGGAGELEYSVSFRHGFLSRWRG